MRRSVLSFALFFIAAGLFLTGCELLNQEVLIDGVEKTVINDSTTIRVLSSVPDSTQLVIETTADWEATVNNDGKWCTLSKTKGVKGKDTIYVHVSENVSTSMRQTSIAISSGTMVKIFRVRQMGGENWIDMLYWRRTAAQRMGLHGKVHRFTSSDNWNPQKSFTYSFDENGNVVSQVSILDSISDRRLTHTYEYDESNHRLTCNVVQNWDSQLICKWKYEYKNTGKLVAYSSNAWEDADPLSEEMEGMIVPDLSAVYKTWKEGDMELHEDRKYTFEGDGGLRLIIKVEKWRDSMGVRIPLELDSMRVTYQKFSGIDVPLPRASYNYSTETNNVTQTTYFENGMLSTLVTVNESYVFMYNVQKMIVKSYAFTGPSSIAHKYDFLECEYNSNRDLLERRYRESGLSGVILEKYPKYQYDDYHNWTARQEELIRPDIDDIRPNFTKRDFIYYR